MIDFKVANRSMSDRINLLHNNRDARELVSRFYADRHLILHVINDLRLIDEVLDDIELAVNDEIPPLVVSYGDHPTIMIKGDTAITYNPQIVLDLDALNHEFLTNDRCKSAVEFLTQRGVTLDQIKKYKLFHSTQVDDETRFILGASLHPDLDYPIDVDPESIVIPVISEGDLIGAHCRYLNTLPYVKFTSSIPNFYLYNNLTEDDVDEVWIVEGVFDAYALELAGVKNWIALSSGYFSEDQYLQLINIARKYPRMKINLMLDSDAVGCRSMYVAWYLLSHFISNEICAWKLPSGKDPAEYIIKCNGKISDLISTNVDDLIVSYEVGRKNEGIVSFDDYLNNRQIQSDQSNYHYKGVNCG